jgi:hypothetical protein
MPRPSPTIRLAPGTRPSLAARAAGTALLAAALLAVAPPAVASPGWGGLLPDVVRLRTGETIKGRLIVERSNEAVAVFEDYASGAVREIAWPAIEEADRDKIQVVLGLKNAEGTTVETACVIVRYKLNVGEDTITGVVQSEDAVNLVLKTAGGLLTIPKSMILSREESTCDATDVYTPDELAAEKKSKSTLESAREWFLYAQFCEAVGAYLQAKEAYEAAAVDPEFLNREVAAAKVTALDALLKDQEAVRTIKDLKMALTNKIFPKVRTGIEKFPEKHPEASKPVLAQVEALKAQLKKERDAYFAVEAGKSFVKILTRSIDAKVKVKDVPFNDVQSWAKRELTELAFADLAKDLQRKDPAVTVEEAKAFWEARPKKGWLHASYGRGTFVVDPPKIKPPSGQGGGSSRSGGGGPTVKLEIPKPPTRDSWWLGETTEGRRAWILAYFAENSGLFEVAPKREKKPCDICQGAGLETKSLTGGGALSYLCTRCAGAQYDQTVKFR